MTTLTSQVLLDGPRNAIVKLQIAGTAGAELASAVAVDVSALDGAPGEVRVMGCESAMDGFTATLAWDADVDVPILTATGMHKMCFRDIGGLPNNAGVGKTGDILISTLGVGANENATLILH